MKKLSTPTLNHRFKMLKQQQQKQKNKDDEFSELKKLYNEIDNAVTKQKQQNEIIDLTDDVFDENNLFNDENR